MRKSHGSIVLLVAAAACGGQASSTAGSQSPTGAAPAAEASTPTTAPPSLTPPAFRLGNVARPTRYQVELTDVPGEKGFSGVIDIDLELAQSTSVLWLNGKGLAVSAASLTVPGQTIGVRAVPAGEEYLGFVLDSTVGPGAARLHVEYTGTHEFKDAAGVFTQKEGDDWYTITQFEATDARRAFPCFDEPSFKVPWELSLVVPRGVVAVSNSPVTAEAERPNGKKVVTFAPTPPLPSYLIAFAVGPFDIVDGGKVGKKGTPLKVYALRGKGNQVRFSLEAMKQSLVRLEDYFGMPYPYEKLDNLSIPFTMTFGAMENPGLVTYAQSILQAKPEEETLSYQRRAMTVVAHEFAHQWFGDYVTLAWWNDIWLNESFASWAEDKITHEWKPEWEFDVAMVSSNDRIMSLDGLTTARQIRQPIESLHDIADAFDGITYGKGESVIAMFEKYVGEETFREGLRAYMKKHAHSTATSADFLAAIAAAANKPAIAEAFATFIEQPGVPALDVQLECKGNQKAPTPPRLLISQERFLPTGSKGQTGQTWHVPMCVRYGDGKTEGRACTLLTEAKGELVLSDAKSCPTWVLPNAGGEGYYRVRYQTAALKQLLGGPGAKGPKLSIGERLSVLGDAQSLVDGGHLQAAEVLGLVPQLAKTPNRHLIGASLRIVSSLDRALVPDAMRPNYARLIRKLFGPHAKELGFKAKPGEDPQVALLRPQVIELAAVQGEDKELAAQASALGKKWLDDHAAVPEEMAGTVLGIAAYYGDQALFDRLLAELGKTKDRKERRRLMSALQNFADPKLAMAAQALALGGQFESREALGLFTSPFSNRKTREAAFDLLKKNFDDLAAKLPGEWVPYLFSATSAFCDEKHRADIEAFFGARAEKYPGGPRSLAQTLERISLCDARRAAQEPSITAFLKKY